MSTTSQPSRSPSPDILKESNDKEKTKSKEKFGGNKTLERKEKDGKKREKTKDKTKKSSTMIEPRNEGQDRNWAYKPPTGMVELDISKVDEEFDWDALQDNEDKELCLFRLPDGFKSKYLDGLEFSISANISETSQKITSFEKRKSKLEIWSVGTHDENNERDSRGQELHSITCLLPRSKEKGALYIAPKPIMHRFLVVHSPATPSTNHEIPLVSAPREAVPPEVLKHRFLPYGATSQRPEEYAVELGPPSIAQHSPPPPKSTSKSNSPRKSSKRKSGQGDIEETSPKKSKKLKAQ